MTNRYSKANQLKTYKPEKEKKKRFKKCRYCGDQSVPYGSLQPFCLGNDWSNECIKKHNEVTIQKKKRKDKKKLLSTDRKHWLKLAVTAFNTFIRKRDEHQPCISCGYIFGTPDIVEFYDSEKGEMVQVEFPSGRQRHAGHLKPAGNNSKLRFNEDNVHAQCSICNNHKSGEVGEYERNLRIRIGNDRVDRVVLIPNEPFTHSVDDLKWIVKTYTKKTKDIMR